MRIDDDRVPEVWIDGVQSRFADRRRHDARQLALVEARDDLGVRLGRVVAVLAVRIASRQNLPFVSQELLDRLRVEEMVHEDHPDVAHLGVHSHEHPKGVELFGVETLDVLLRGRV